MDWLLLVKDREAAFYFLGGFYLCWNMHVLVNASWCSCLKSASRCRHAGSGPKQVITSSLDKSLALWECPVSLAGCHN